MSCLMCMETSFQLFQSFLPRILGTPVASTHFDTHLASHRALVDAAAKDSLSHECSNVYTAHVIDDGHLQSVTTELTVSQHVVASKWSKSFLSGFSILSGLHVCLHPLHLMPRCPHFHFGTCHQDPLRSSTTCYPLIPIACGMNVAATSDVLLPSCNSDMALCAVLHTFVPFSC